MPLPQGGGKTQGPVLETLGLVHFKRGAEMLEAFISSCRGAILQKISAKNVYFIVDGNIIALIVVAVVSLAAFATVVCVLSMTR